MARKPGRMYRQIRGQAYCRREYMGGVPASRINTFDLGVPNGDFAITISLKAKEACQIRHTALEAARITCNRILTKLAGGANYHMKIRVYPHHVLRENKLATGAGADRVSSGMRAAFGKAVGTAARVSPGQTLITVRVPVQYVAVAKEALWSASLKLPTPCFTDIEKGAELVH
jgi:large subunit ribosomal protein L10e